MEVPFDPAGRAMEMVDQAMLNLDEIDELIDYQSMVIETPVVCHTVDCTACKC